MKKTWMKIAAIALVLVLTLSLAACTKKTQTTFKPDGESKGTLTLGFDAEYPPYGYLDTETNQYAGFDIDFAKAVCNKLGYTLVLSPIVWDFKDSALESGEIDFIWNGFTINGREEDYEWTVPYVDSSIVVLTMNDSGITTLADLAGKIVTVQNDSSGQNALDSDDCADLLASFKDGKYLTCKDYNTAYQDLKTGAVDAVVIDIGVAQSYLVNGDCNILEEAVYSEQYGVGFLKGNTALRDEIQTAMVDMAKNSAIIAELLAKYDTIEESSIVLEH